MEEGPVALGLGDMDCIELGFHKELCLSVQTSRQCLKPFHQGFWTVLGSLNSCIWGLPAFGLLGCFPLSYLDNDFENIKILSKRTQVFAAHSHFLGA